MSAGDRFLVPPEVIHQTIDDEVILVHLALGTYHSLRGCGAPLFAALAAGASAQELAAQLFAQTTGERSIIEAAVSRFVEELVREQLVSRAPASNGAAANPIAGPDASAKSATAKQPFEEPRLETFNDLRDLLNADPVHDVDPAGWPVMAKEKAVGG